LKILETATIGHRVCRLSTLTAFDRFGILWDAPHHLSEATSLIQLTRARFDDLRLQGSLHPYPCDGLLIGVMQLCRQCRDFNLRRLALGLCRDLLSLGSGPDNTTNTTSTTTTRDVRSVVMGLRAVVRAEELGRDGEGRIGKGQKWEWTSGSWNRDYSELRVGLSRMVVREDGTRETKTLLVRVDDV
jgi:hypothetical protein